MNQPNKVTIKLRIISTKIYQMGKDEEIKDALKPTRDLIELVYGDKTRLER